MTGHSPKCKFSYTINSHRNVCQKDVISIDIDSDGEETYVVRKCCNLISKQCCTFDDEEVYCSAHWKAFCYELGWSPELSKCANIICDIKGIPADSPQGF